MLKNPTQKKLRILIPFPSPFLYGAERTILETFDLLRPEAEPHFLLSHGALRRKLPVLRIMKEKRFTYSFMSDRDDWPVPGKPQSISHLWEILWSLAKFNMDCLKNSRRKDVLSLSNVQMLYSALLVCIIFRLQRKKVIFRFHELMIPWTPYSFALKLASPLVTDFLHHTQHGMEKTLQTNTFLVGRNNCVIPPPVSVRTGDMGDSEAESFAGKRNIIIVGQVSPHKGVDLLIEAFKEVAPDYEDAILHILGGCSDSYRDEFHRSIEPLEKQGRIRYWGFREDVHSFVKVAQVLVQPTRPSLYHEGYARTIIEGMALGIPSICFRSGALQEVVIDEHTGIICEEESSQCLAKALRRFLDDFVFRSECAERSRQLYEEKYSPDGVKKKWLQFFEQWTN